MDICRIIHFLTQRTLLEQVLSSFFKGESKKNSYGPYLSSEPLNLLYLHLAYSANVKAPLFKLFWPCNNSTHNMLITSHPLMCMFKSGCSIKVCLISKSSTTCFLMDRFSDGKIIFVTELLCIFQKTRKFAVKVGTSVFMMALDIVMHY